MWWMGNGCVSRFGEPGECISAIYPPGFRAAIHFSPVGEFVDARIFTAFPWAGRHDVRPYA